MKAISLHQPSATLVALKLKTIETRTHARFKGLVGQRIAIHAAQKWNDDGLSVTRLAENGRLGHGVSIMLAGQNIQIWAQRCRGQIVCTAVVKDAVWEEIWTSDYLVNKKRDLEAKALCDVGGKYLLFLEDIQPLKEPVPFKGGRGIFNVPDELVGE